MGAYALRRRGEEEEEDTAFWVPAYHSYETGKSTGKVVDVTGAGNSFLVRIGGSGAGCSSWRERSIWLTRNPLL